MLIILIKKIANTAFIQMKGRYINIKFENVEFRNVQKFLIQDNVKFKSYVLEDVKPLKVIFRDLSINTGVQDIKNTIENFFGVRLCQNI